MVPEPIIVFSPIRMADAAHSTDPLMPTLRSNISSAPGERVLNTVG